MSVERKGHPSAEPAGNTRRAPLCYTRQIAAPCDYGREPADTVLKVLLVVLSIGLTCAAFLTVGSSWALQ